MRTIRALAAAAALAGLLAASGPAAAKIMQLTLGGKTIAGFHDVTGIMGVGGGIINSGYNIDFVFTYDTALPVAVGFNGSAPTLLSARNEIHLPPPEDPFGETFTPGGELAGFFNIPVGQNDPTHGNQNYIRADGGYYTVNSSFGSPTEVGGLFIYFPGSGAGLLDQDMTYYPDPSSSVYGFNRFYGNSIYDLQFLKHDANGVLLHDIHTETLDTGAINTFYVNFKDITPQGVPEPAAWALMLLGFGGVGAALRRRRAVGLAL